MKGRVEGNIYPLHSALMLPILLLLFGGPARPCLALKATGESGSENARVIRSEQATDGGASKVDRLHIELDSQGKGHVDTANLAEKGDGPQVVNSGFEEGSTTGNYQYSNYVPGWSKEGNVAYIKSDGAAFKVKASHGNYLLGLAGKGSGVYQSVSGHIPGNWYRLVFHSAYRTTHEAAKLRVSVGSAVKMEQEPASGTLGWYEVTYKAPYADVVISFMHMGPDQNFASTAYLDGIDIKPVQLWDTKQNSAMVLLQKVTCDGYPSKDTCTRGKFLTIGDYSDDGATTIGESDVANQDAVWIALHRGGSRWSFKSNSLNQPSPDGDGPTRSGTMWFLHSDYSTCQAKNWFTTATSSYHVELNSLGVHEVSDVGTECGSLFAIQKFARAETIAEDGT